MHFQSYTTQRQNLQRNTWYHWMHQQSLQQKMKVSLSYASNKTIKTIESKLQKKSIKSNMIVVNLNNLLHVKSLWTY